MVAAVRVDERLLHGQVLIKWVEHYRCQRVVVLDEKTRADPFLMSVMRASLPRGVQLDVYGLIEGSGIFEDKEERRALVLLRDVGDMCTLVHAGAPVTAVNLARHPHDTERTLLRELIAHGINVTVQLVPDSPRESLNGNGE